MRFGKSKPVDSENQFRHEEFFPTIISREDWLALQRLLKDEIRFAKFKNTISALAASSEPFVLQALTDCAVACLIFEMHSNTC